MVCLLCDWQIMQNVDQVFLAHNDHEKKMYFFENPQKNDWGDLYIIAQHYLKDHRLLLF